MCAFVLGKETICLVYNLYAHTNGENCNGAAERTKDIIRIILDDIKQQPKGPVLILGDLNCRTAMIQCLQDELEQGRLIDVGVQAQKMANPVKTSHAKRIERSAQQDVTTYLPTQKPSNLLRTLKSTMMLNLMCIAR